MLRDEAQAFLARRRPHRVRRHGPADAARRAARPARDATSAGDGQALALLQAVGGFQAYRRAVPAPPNARPGRPLPALRARLSRLGGRLGRRAARGADRADTSPRNSEPVLRLQPPGRRPGVPRRAPADGAAIWRDLRGGAATSSRASTRDIADRYFAGAARHRGTTVVWTADALRDPTTSPSTATTARSPTTSTRCACARRRPPRSAVDDFHVRVDPETRAAAATWTTSAPR